MPNLTLYVIATDEHDAVEVLVNNDPLDVYESYGDAAVELANRNMDGRIFEVSLPFDHTDFTPV